MKSNPQSMSIEMITADSAENCVRSLFFSAFSQNSAVKQNEKI
jgi:hypothetical protein